MGKTSVTNADPKEMEKAMGLWVSFTKIMTVTVVSVAVLLVLMVTFLV